MTPQTVFCSSDGGEIVQGLTLTRLDSTQAMPSWIFAAPFGELQITRDWSSTTTVVERSECWDFFLRIDFVWGVSTRVLFGRATHTHTHTHTTSGRGERNDGHIALDKVSTGREGCTTGVRPSVRVRSSSETSSTTDRKVVLQQLA